MVRLVPWIVMAIWQGALGAYDSSVRRRRHTTCGSLKELYKENTCCGNPSKVLPEAMSMCPYNFEKPACANAEPQSPRDLSTGAEGDKIPKAIVLTESQAMSLPLVNVHFHLGAEHKSDNYADDSESTAWDASSTKSGPRPGWKCGGSLSSYQLAPYSFVHCKGVEVGKTYEVHYVHSTAGVHRAELGDNADMMADGLGGAANGRGLLNPMVVVQGQVFRIVNGAPTVSDMLHGWTVVDHSDSVMYSGSTTGPSHDNTVCSPYVISWHVDRVCHDVAPASFDNMCKQMKDNYNLDQDLKPHGSRILVSRAFVVPAANVTALM